MDILFIAGIVLIFAFAVLILKKRSNKKINYKDRIKLETILENDKPIKKIMPMIKLEDESIKYYDKGVALVIGKKYEESIPYLNEVIRINSNEATTYYYRGIAKSKLNLFKDAIDDFTDAMLHKIKDVDAFFQRGYARLKIEDNENALLDFTHYVSIEKNNPEAFYQKGVLEYEKENYQIAINDFSNAIILTPNHGSAYFKRGMAKQIIGDISGCCKDLKTAFDKGYLEAYHYMKKFCDK